MSKKICICQSLRCRQNGSEKLLEKAKEEVKGTDIQVDRCGCLGGCEYGPNAEITSSNSKKEIQYTVTPSFLSQLINKLKS